MPVRVQTPSNPDIRTLELQKSREIDELETLSNSQVATARVRAEPLPAVSLPRCIGRSRPAYRAKVKAPRNSSSSVSCFKFGPIGARDSDSKRSRGAYFTVGNPFHHPAFAEWAQLAALRTQDILEPFAGSNSLIRHLEDMGLCSRFTSFDIAPSSVDVQQRDTLKSFPTGYSVCVTNPPWLAKNSATYRGLPYPASKYDNLYKHCLAKCLDRCEWVAAIVPESFLCANIFQDRLAHCISLSYRLFRDTGHPTCLALFGPQPTPDVLVWVGTKVVGWLNDLNRLRPRPRQDGCNITFNRADGNLGLIALDNTLGPSIRFCEVEELADYTVKHSGRHITKLHVDCELEIDLWNRFLNEFRAKTKDVLITCYKGVRKDGMYRRRLDWQLARGIIHSCQEGVCLQNHLEWS